MTKVLIIEDEISLQDLYADFLREAGFNVSTASDGDKAVELINSLDWDILLLDIMLPKLDGTEILKRVKTDLKLKSKPVVVLSNLESDLIVKECLDLGARDFLIKSDITPQTILDVVNKYLPPEPRA